MIAALALLMLGAAAPAPFFGDATGGPEVAACVVDNDMTDVRSLLRTLPGSQAEARAGKKLLGLYGGCNDNKVVAGVFAWHERAEIAEAAATRLLDRKAVDVVTTAGQPGWALVVPAGAKPPADYDVGDVGMRVLGDCVVRANPQGALSLLRADRGTAAESAAIAALSPNLASCLTGGQTLKLKRQDLRLVVAEPLYHLLSR